MGESLPLRRCPGEHAKETKTIMYVICKLLFAYNHHPFRNMGLTYYIGVAFLREMPVRTQEAQKKNPEFSVI